MSRLTQLDLELAGARAVVADLEARIAAAAPAYYADPAYLCGECGTISRYGAWIALRYDESGDTLVPAETGGDDPILRCPACGHDHRDDDSGAGMYGDTFGVCLLERDRLVAERTERHGVDWQDLWLDRWDSVAEERRAALR
jgi:hypothetical protein